MRESMFVYNRQLHWKIVDWDTLQRHYSLIIVTIITENYRLLSTLDTSLVSDETGSSALERETHLGCQPQLQTVRSKFRDSLEHPDLGAAISEPLLLRRRYKI